MKQPENAALEELQKRIQHRIDEARYLEAKFAHDPEWSKYYKGREDGLIAANNDLDAVRTGPLLFPASVVPMSKVLLVEHKSKVADYQKRCSPVTE